MRYLYLLIPTLIIILLSGCKPTERNYREAYDAALAKREAANKAAADDDADLISEEAPRRIMVNGDTLYVSNDKLRLTPDLSAKIKAYNVGIAVYKMNTNAYAAADRLVKEGYGAYAAQTTGNRWYVIAGSFDTAAEASTFIRKFLAKKPAYPLIGLSTPVIILR